MNKIIFTCKYFNIRVRELLLALFVLLLLIFGLKAYENNETEKKKQEKIENICDFTNRNINDFNKLMSRADLCSKAWFKDLEAFITRIKDQNSHLLKKEKKKFKTVLKYQKEVFKDLKSFKKNQEDKNIDELKKSFKKYKKYYDGTCMKGKKGK